MKTKITFLVVLFISNFVLSQTEECLTPSNTKTELEIYEMLNPVIESTANDTFCVKVYFHIIKKSDGSGGKTTDDANEAFRLINEAFNPHNIFFNWDNTIDIIKNNAIYGNEVWEKTTDVFEINNNEDGIDIYLFDDNYHFRAGKSIGIGKNTEVWVSGPLVRTHTVSHEIGHVLNLYHTFHGTVTENSSTGSDPNQCTEYVNGSQVNRENCGDYIADTPADPYFITPIDNVTCTWAEYKEDPVGDKYEPDGTLIMSYAGYGCRTRFSPLQGKRMREALLNLAHLKHVSSDTCTPFSYATTITDRLCNTNTKTVTINNKYNASSYTTVWEKSDNVEIVSSSNNAITIRALTSSSFGSGFVKATVNGIELEMINFDVGVPFGYSNGVIGIHPYPGNISGGLYLNNWTPMWIPQYSSSEPNWEWSVNYSLIQGQNGSSQVKIKPYITGYITVKARRSNECGCGEWLSTNYYVTQFPSGGQGYTKIEK
ncbi:hypothetical protein [Polaribacter uvawellassae]|uniref:hypothetical protein n=1 Tax=Polaribacter uvawellassae TaxID=3133495 RepID=UPI00321BA92D